MRTPTAVAIAAATGALALVWMPADATPARVPPPGPATHRASVNELGHQLRAGSDGAVISRTGRYVAYESQGHAVATDTGRTGDVFVRDRWTHSNQIVSVATNGTAANSHSADPAISPDGRYVAFVSLATNLAPDGDGQHVDVFLRDRTQGSTELVSVAPGGAAGNGDSYSAAVSADGRYVAFQSDADDLVPGDDNQVTDIFVRDLGTDTTRLASVTSAGAQGDGYSEEPSISADGRRVAFASASRLVPGPRNFNVFVHNMVTGRTRQASLGAAHEQPEIFGFSGSPVISADGGTVAFYSMASNLVPGDDNQARDVFVRDLSAGTTTRVSVGTSGQQGDSDSDISPGAVSADGTRIAFASFATTLVPGDTNRAEDHFVKDLTTGRLWRVSVGVNGQAEQALGGGSTAISGSGRFVAFRSLASNLVAHDTNNESDILVRARFDATP